MKIVHKLVRFRQKKGKWSQLYGTFTANNIGTDQVFIATPWAAKKIKVDVPNSKKKAYKKLFKKNSGISSKAVFK